MKRGNFMKRAISTILCQLLVFSMLGCGGKAPTGQAGATDGATQPSTNPEPTVSQAAIEALDGKKILFIGNSYTHRGNAVIHKGYDALTQEERSNDQGYFYQICKENGIDVSVTNWCFGSHNITDTFAPACTCKTPCEGVDHPSYLTDRNFDYVAIQCFSEKQYESDLVSYIRFASIYREFKDIDSFTAELKSLSKKTRKKPATTEEKK